MIVLTAITIEVIFIGITTYNSPTVEIKALIEKYPDLMDPENEKLREFITNHITMKREYISDMSKTILVNVLLPILTAILGYIFGSREGAG